MQGEPSYRFYSCAALQRAGDVLPVGAARGRAGAAGDDRPGARGCLDAQSRRAVRCASIRALDVPRYVAALDVHLVPGWVHAEHTADDVAQGAVVAFGGKVFTGPAPLSQARRAWSASRSPPGSGEAPRASRRAACSTWAPPTARTCCPTWPRSRGIEAARHRRRRARCCAIAHALAGQRACRRTSASRTPSTPTFPDGHFDLIVSSFFLHEVPVKATRKHPARVPPPAGAGRHHGAHGAAGRSGGQRLRELLLELGHPNNNEPNYTAFRAQDPRALCAEAGFDPAQVSSRTLIPDCASFGDEKFARFVRGELARAAARQRRLVRVRRRQRR